MVMKNFLIGLSKFVLGLILAMLIMSLAGLAMARYFMTRMVEQPERPTYETDLPEDQRPVAKAPDDNPEKSEGPGVTIEKPEPESEAEPEPEEASSDADARATSNLNLRSGPGTSFDSIGGVGLDEGLTIIGEKDGWLNVKLSDGNEGWVSASYVSRD